MDASERELRQRRRGLNANSDRRTCVRFCRELRLDSISRVSALSPELHVTAVPEPAAESGVVKAEHAAESFMGVVFRRTRYAVAIVLSGWLFCTLGWMFAAPPADWGGVSLLVWG